MDTPFEKCWFATNMQTSIVQAKTLGFTKQLAIWFNPRGDLDIFR